MDFFNKLAEQFIKANRRLKKWQRVVSALAAVVVFVTTYAMVLPAITLDKETASAQAGIKIAASENDPESGGTVYEAESAEESLEVLSEEEPEEEKPATESSDTESESREAEVSEEHDEEPEEDNSGENTETEDDQSIEAEYLPNDTDAAYDTKEDAASETLTNENAEEENSAEEVRLITEDTQLIYEYIDEEFENGIEDENEDGIDDGYFVYAEFGADAKLPEGVELTAEEITKESDPEVYEAYYEKALSGLQDKYDENTELSFAKFYDIRFVYNGEEIEPSGDVKVRIEYKKAVKIEKETNVDAVHFDKNNDEEPEVIDSEVEAEKKSRDDTVKTVEFESAQFSVYGIIGSYTVDFHWEVDGKTYDFSIPGGGFVSFYDLVEILGIEVNDTDTDEDEIQKLVDGVESIEFSDPELVSVSKAEEDTTVGAIKDGLDLEYEYSEELKEGEIEQINAQEVRAGDWVLISMKPFDTEESLTVTMKNGDVFTICVTDANIPKEDVQDGTGYILFTRGSDNNYYVLKADGTTQRFDNADGFDELTNEYKWTVMHVYTEDEQERFNIHAYTNPAYSLALNNPGRELLAPGANNIIVDPSGDGYTFTGFNNTMLGLVQDGSAKKFAGVTEEPAELFF